MLVTRLLAVVILVSCWAGRLCAQSQNDDFAVAASLAASDVSSSNPVADLFRLDPTLQTWFTPESSVETNFVAGNHADVYAHRSAEHLIRIPVDLNKLTTDLQSPFDATCYAIRSYLVVRDSPHSDVTRRNGSTTCVPAARIRMYSTTDRETGQAVEEFE